ncbi:uncharacterized protein EURHEDRAFT_410719 [Aspergillus ruber CBS 135680]|uniref:Uncharacterized protein n=1 Tax=Aspergillus ruber (strain CBS 135680) TaxID=1388766 RepID=A0A017SIZ9_ASPRC|nr:uncharacterized protein EURHEDRAFT_410719 [Aspergillus ruber CBS 135680]EYE96928.1 hypothetical protein EURHEDRAFT_410719 [Aspergillus ruber CBS 135680]
MLSLIITALIITPDCSCHSPRKIPNVLDGIIKKDRLDAPPSVPAIRGYKYISNSVTKTRYIWSISTIEWSIYSSNQ